MNTVIESASNPRIKELVKLRESPKRRRERKAFVVEGADDLLALARADRKVNEIYFCPALIERLGENLSFAELSKMNIPMQETSQKAQSKGSYRSSGQGVIGIVQAWELGLDQLSTSGDKPLVILDEIEKPGNLGAVLRTVEAFGGDGVILSDSSVDFFNPNVVRSSRGCMGQVAAAVAGKEDVWSWLERSGRELIATSAHADHSLSKERIASSTAFIFGSEKEGLGEFWKSRVSRMRKIPMVGKASSLNLNVSVACALYECNRS